jgi:hypothetical protein
MEQKNKKTEDKIVIISSCKQKPIYGVIHSICLLISIYLSFKRNNGFSLGSFLMAITVPQFYIIYVFATQQNLKTLYPGHIDK